MDDEVSAEMATPPHANNKMQFFRTAVEIPVFLYFLTHAISDTVISNLILYRTCTVTFKYNETMCTAVINGNVDNATQQLEEEIQPYASSVIMYRMAVEGTFPALISLFLGPWSDKNGRKPLIVFSLLGYAMYFSVILVYYMISYADPMYLILAGIPYSMFGGVPSIITGSFCYISDITDDTNRSTRMLILEGAFLIGMLLGSIFSSYIFQLLNYLGVLCLCVGLSLLAMLYSIVILKESTLLSRYRGYFSMFFDLTLIRDMFSTCFKRRSNHRRSILWLVMLSSSFGIFVLQGDLTVLYLYMREKIKWNLHDYTFYIAFSIGATILGLTIVTLLFQKCLKMRDTTISMISYFSDVVRSAILTFINKSWMMYLCAGVTCLRSSSGPMNRSILTKIVPNEDVGKVMSLTTSLETIIPITSNVIYAYIYKSTVTTFPGAFNILSASIYTTCFILMGIVHYTITKYILNNCEREVDEQAILNQED